MAAVKKTEKKQPKMVEKQNGISAILYIAIGALLGVIVSYIIFRIKY